MCGGDKMTLRGLVSAHKPGNLRVVDVFKSLPDKVLRP
jgi:hypothetical protein